MQGLTEYTVPPTSPVPTHTLFINTKMADKRDIFMAEVKELAKKHNIGFSIALAHQSEDCKITYAGRAAHIIGKDNARGIARSMAHQLAYIIDGITGNVTQEKEIPTQK